MGRHGQTAGPRGDAGAHTTDVVVVGAGPVGMTAAALLAARGVSVTVLERNATTSDAPKAISIDDEALRTFQAAGLAARLERIVVPGTGTRYLDAAGRAAFTARSAWPFRLGHPFKNPFAQPDLERELAEHLREAPPVALRLGTEVLAIAQDADGVEVTTSRGDTVRARYLLACDGGRSTVREQLGIRMAGRSFDEVWLVADVLEDPHDERYGTHHGDPARPTVVVPGRHGRCRYEFLLHPGEGEAGAPPPFALLARLLRPHRRITPEQVERCVAYRFHALVAERFASGRAFLLGDAAHMMPPFAGQGLNSGIRDAANLCWKIADVLAGRLDEAALDTYETERRRHAQDTVRLSVRLGRIVMTTDRRLAERRDRVVARLLGTPEGRAHLEEMRYRPVQHHRAGLVAPGADDGPATGVVLGQPRVHDTATGRTTMLDDVLGPGWALLGVDVPASALDAAAAACASLDPVVAHVPADDRLPRATEARRVLVDLDGGLDREAAPYRGRVVLLRPDRFVAAAWSAQDVAAGRPGRDLATALHLAAHDETPTPLAVAG
ncbi:bifunctional 3-(3-hydroxy-phenyl)propionate/3-hydroxycinnamic acid hydroxylase [Actinomycetospora chlora]|uniref:Bifunctional 3-(3-hydroxy-phenyl)propionate/3-hydroxycinnamic acid hydroxylase n=1 Tax=Actinomycetospora chlora TaxID=663608 RepID=A0ABP9AL28_9PSEU